jgi:hypothetical protein
VRAIVVLAAAAVVATGCGGDGDANAIMRETAAKLGEIRSAKPFMFRFAVDPQNGEEFGFAVDGALALCRRGERLPRLDVAYTQFAQGETATVQLVSTGRAAFIEVDGTAYVLPDEQEAELRGACDDLVAEGGLAQLRVDDWVVEAEADGDNTVRGRLDVVAVVNDLVDVARAFGGSRLARLDADDARRLASATRESSFELERGDDGLLRRLALLADLGVDVPQDLRNALGDAVGAKITFELQLDEPNTPIQISPPESPRPASELPSGNR